MSIKFNANEIRFIALFESMTGAMVKDCILDDENSKVTFVVKNGDMGLAIGKGGSTVTKVKKAVGRGVEIIEHNEDPAQFIKNVLSPMPRPGHRPLPVLPWCCSWEPDSADRLPSPR